MPARGDSDLAHWPKFRGTSAPNPEGAPAFTSMFTAGTAWSWAQPT